jgi:hypothetical protein
MAVAGHISDGAVIACMQVDDDRQHTRTDTG